MSIQSPSLSLFTLVTLCSLMAACSDDGSTDSDSGETTPEVAGVRSRFTITLENTSSPGSLEPDGAEPQDIMYAPGVWARITDTPWLVPGEPASDPLEGLAEDGQNTPMLRWLEGEGLPAGVFGADDPGTGYDDAPIVPGDTITFAILADPGDRLTLASMWIQSNDLFIGTTPEGIALFGENGPVEGDATAQLKLWDAGTETNQEPGAGDSQAPRQSAMNEGDDEGGVIAEVDGSDGFTYPDLSTTVSLRIELAARQP